MKRLGAVDLTNGKVMLSILRFSWPIFVGNAFQQLYNVVDMLFWGGTRTIVRWHRWDSAFQSLCQL